MEYIKLDFYATHVLCVYGDEDFELYEKPWFNCVATGTSGDIIKYIQDKYDLDWFDATDLFLEMFDKTV